jgi:hypothetical protein
VFGRCDFSGRFYSGFAIYTSPNAVENYRKRFIWLRARTALGIKPQTVPTPASSFFMEYSEEPIFITHPNTLERMRAWIDPRRPESRKSKFKRY